MIEKSGPKQGVETVLCYDEESNELFKQKMINRLDQQPSYVFFNSDNQLWVKHHSDQEKVYVHGKFKNEDYCKYVIHSSSKLDMDKHIYGSVDRMKGCLTLAQILVDNRKDYCL